MRLSLDGKSLAVGVFAGVAFVAAFGAMQNTGPEAGRFQMEAAGDQRDTTAYVLDTATGQVWRESGSNADFLRPKPGREQ